VKWGKALFNLITRNLGWKLLSLAIAVVVWGMVANEPELSSFATAGVEYRNLPDDLEISSDPVSSVKLELRGPSGQLRGIGEGGAVPEVILDMSKVLPGDRTFPIGDGNIKMVRGVHLVRAIPSEVRFRFERRAGRTLPVTPRFREREGFEVSSFTVKPEAIAIEGPASHVAQVDTVLTDQVNIPARAGTFEYPVNTFVDDPFVRFPNLSRVSVTVTVRKK
jgi:hypothetical protein